jgi:two-component system, OmpR family, phosphate regulon sensor histidine kinase PhoR
MRRLRLTWQMYGLFMVAGLLAIALSVAIALREVREFAIQQTEAQLMRAASAVAPEMAYWLAEGREEEIRTRGYQLARYTGHRVALILPEGTVIFDSGNILGEQRTLVGTPETVSIFRGGAQSATRISRGSEGPIMHLALPLPVAGEVAGALRLSALLGSKTMPLNALESHLLWWSLAVVLFLASVTLLITQRLNRPLNLLKSGAERLARGHLGARLPVPESEDLADVVHAINRLAAELQSRIQTALEQRNELEAVLTSMMEGVIAVDARARVININSAASELFGVTVRNVSGQSLEVAVRHTELQDFVRRTLESDSFVEDEIIVYHEGRRYLQAHGTRLRNTEGKVVGGVVALNDVTRLRRLEQARRDFVANVSHELRTPITSIKGYVETLLDGALEDSEHSREFIEIVSRQANRLNSLIEDLLMLSRVEQEAEDGAIELQRGSLRSVVEGAVQICAEQAKNRGIPLEFVYQEDATVLMNSQLLQQAVVNLIENAINYSEAGEAVEVRVEAARGTVRVRVADHGCGIAPDHLPRLFERFYRADRARSRKQGGTGLGLAIVKHIVRVHGGRALVESKLGQGSIFTIELPRPPHEERLMAAAGH